MMAELMLRRTRSDQVAAVYERFAQRYENAEQASRDPEGVRDTLRSLGLNWRNEQVLDTIQFLAHRYGKDRKLSQDTDLTEVPGIGDYCNSMLRSRMFGEPRSAIDSNVARIYCRLIGETYHPEARRKKWLIDLCQRFMQIATGRDGRTQKQPAKKRKEPEHDSTAAASCAEEPSRDPFEINLAFLDLAALVCKPGRPDCHHCPIRKQCITGVGRN